MKYDKKLRKNEKKINGSWYDPTHDTLPQILVKSKFTSQINFILNFCRKNQFFTQTFWTMKKK